MLKRMDMDYENAVLENFKVCNSKPLDANLLKDRNVDLKAYLDRMNNLVINEYSTFFQGEPIATPTIKFPKTWWQQFKRDKMPKWFTNRFPVRYNTYGLDLAYIYKDYIPNFNRPGRFTIIRDIHEK